ncbi:MAG: iron-containing alcohol dehydrogenase [Deltaproteobacteria bacterium]|nr:iron-containing alcohol dehydrogenase [Candidatus Zymogenaceae bacterium]
MKYPDIAFDPFFIWLHRPRIMYSPGLRAEIAYEMEQLGGTRAVIYTDAGLVDAGVVDMVTEEIKKSGLALVGVFDEIVQDARIDVVNEGVVFYRKNGADCMVVIGGGSVMDTAKAVNIMIGEGHDDFAPLADQAALHDTAKLLPPHIAFPTTAGTGSEITTGIVVLDVRQRQKIAVSHPYCNCDIAMLDPELTTKLPPRITAFTGMDALTHAIEGMTSTAAEPIGDALSLHAIKLIFTYLPAAVKEPENIDARGHMLLASTMAGMAFSNTMTGAVHALAHALGGRYGIPHGLANGMMLPHVMAFNVEEVPERFMLIADAMGCDVAGMDPIDAGKLAVEAVHALKKEIGLTDTLKDHGVTDDGEDLSALAELAVGDSQISYNPRYVEEEDLLEIYKDAL